MASPEFDLINRYFSAIGPRRQDVVLGVGDDCALLQVPPGQQLAVSIDTLVEGVHFSPATDPQALGHKALAVNLSDLAAMGAEPAWATLALTLPDIDPTWLAAFSRGFSLLAERANVCLVGGDTTRGSLSITVQVHGLVPQGQAIYRSGAQPGDLIYVSGTLGDAALGLRLRQAGVPVAEIPAGLLQHLDRPEPRLQLGSALRGVASAAIDLSDGLLADLGHICECSSVGASLLLDRIPLCRPVQSHIDASADWSVALAGGDDYELCFTLPVDHCQPLLDATAASGIRLTRIGVIEPDLGVRCLAADGQPVTLSSGGYDHFHHLS